MSEQQELAARVADSARPVIGVLNDSLLGHARHAADLSSRAADPNEDIDPLQELGRLLTRTARDGARFVVSIWAMLEALAGEPGQKAPPPSDKPPVTNPLKTTIRPVAARGKCQADGLRRRGETSATIAATQIAVTRNAADQSQLDVAVEAGGAPRGLYEGMVKIGSGANPPTISYNMYVDW